MNSQIFGLGDRLKAQVFDLVDFYFKDMEEKEGGGVKGQENQSELSFYRKIMDEIKIPFQVDLVLCNPPWIPAGFVKETSPLDNGVYDPEEKFLKSALNFCRLHLSKSGEMLLVYSDLAYQLGL